MSRGVCGAWHAVGASDAGVLQVVRPKCAARGWRAVRGATGIGVQEHGGEGGHAGYVRGRELGRARERLEAGRLLGRP